ncbi:cbb3-type cytochrome oxidase assembly protein CcoS [Defluviicoccus vanus]|uniref:cbb3-type cytochrome oxidase assembly protein CcoS n=1 Tax=Defluviicoccus vanus TaxID=111831 RepID=UPI001CBA6B87|nr:cbb3-type cytochrome oxidase assembly protein CcoS [Defluviicoccus vanus]
MDVIIYLIPLALLLGLLGLGAFLWALKSGQFDDLDGAAHRILFEDEETRPDDSSRSESSPGRAGARQASPEDQTQAAADDSNKRA